MWRRSSLLGGFAGGISLYLLAWLLLCNTNLAVTQENNGDDLADNEPLVIFVRFDGVGCQPLCNEKFDPTWVVLSKTFPGAAAQKIDCENQPMFCTRHGARIKPNGPAFAYILTENQQWHWYEGPQNIYALLLWIETTMHEVAASKQDDGLQTHRNFDRIYYGNMWLQNTSGSSGSGSGTGSTHGVNMDYISMISKLIVDYDIQSIVDVGCGDFTVMSHVNLGNATYHGWDVSSIAIERASQREQQSKTEVSNQSTSSTDMNIRFSVSGVDQQFEPADLVLVKDVLQHLPLREAMAIVSQLHKFKYAIIVNDVVENTPNKDNDFETGLRMVPGGYRSTNVELPPFNLHCNEKLLLHSTLRRRNVAGATKTTCFIIVSDHDIKNSDTAADIDEGSGDADECSTTGSTCFQAIKEHKEAERASVSKHREAFLMIAYWREYADLAKTYEATGKGHLRYNIGLRLKFLEQTLGIPKEHSVLADE